ncbi:MAG: T9SS type A sorting domain-containing protein [Flavobacteriales bacterium]|nr:T9SS type A sorting domain-containing protein [Flavobacteriales bacterium]
MEKKFYQGLIAIALLPFFYQLNFAFGGDGSSTITIKKQDQKEIHTIAVQVASIADVDINNLQILSATHTLVNVKDVTITGNIIHVTIDIVPTAKGDKEDEDIIDVIEIVGIDNITGVFINPGGQQNTATAYVNNGTDDDANEHHTDHLNTLPTVSEMVILNHHQTEQVPIASPNSGTTSFVRDMLVYPNPAKDELGVVTVGEILGKSIVIVDMSGKVHKEIIVAENTHKTTIDISDLPAGIYLVNLSATNGKTYIQKFYKVD